MHLSATSTLIASASALVSIVLAMGSLASTIVGLWVTTALLHATADREASILTYGPWRWVVAIAITLGVPLILAMWKHPRNTHGLSHTMLWLPLVWNSCGLTVASQTVPDVMGMALRSYGASVATDSVGESHAGTRVLSALSHEAADRVDPAGTPALLTSTLRQWTATEDGQIEPNKALSVPFTDEGTAIVLDVELGGPEGSTTLPYLFDTGASFTTISSSAAAALGVHIPDDAPMLTFNTASGQRQSKMVYLPRLRLGEVELNGLVVSVCDGCVNSRHQGLLGHNVMRQFFAQIDFRNQRMVLLPRAATSTTNRAYDIEQMVDMEVEGGAELWLGRVHWVVVVHNRGTQPLTNVVPAVKFAGGPTLRGRSIAEIAPGSTGRSLVEGRVNLGDNKRAAKGHFTLGLAEAFW